MSTWRGRSAGIWVFQSPTEGQSSDSNEVRNNNKRDANRDENNIVGNKVRKDHQGEAADQRHDSSLLLAIQEKAEADGAEEQTPEQ